MELDQIVNEALALPTQQQAELLNRLSQPAGDPAALAEMIHQLEMIAERVGKLVVLEEEACRLLRQLRPERR